MNIEVIAQPAASIATDLLVVGYFKGSERLEGDLEKVDSSLSGAIGALIADGEITGKEKETVLLHTFQKIPARRVLIVGLGERHLFTEEKVRLFAAVVVRNAQRLKAKTAAVCACGFDQFPMRHVAHKLAEGAYLANYHFEGYASAKDDPVVELESIHVVVGKDSAEWQVGFASGVAYAEGTNLARTLANTPGNLLTPTDMANEAVNIAKRYGFEYEVLEKADMERLGMGGILAVAQGSAQPPKMIVLKYQGTDNWDNVLGFVGKGITFDSGGISIKPANNMEDMKMDMGGGAAVLGAMEAIGRMKPNVNVLAVVGCTENMPSGSAYKPGDVIQTMSGKTIEVWNTDAEGRIVLADAITYAKHLGAQKVVDLATLTGAVVVALGNVTTAAMTNDGSFLEEFLASAKLAGEKVWHMPTFDEYKEQIKSSIADVVNTGVPGAGSITAALFVGTFAEDTPWIHLDIAGTAWTKKDSDLNEKGATGVMVRSLVELAHKYAGKPK